MDNFRKCCVFYNHISSWAPTTRWGGEVGEVGARPYPSWEHKITISTWGAFSPSSGGFSLHMKDLFSPFGGGGIVSPFALFWGLFFPCEGLFFAFFSYFSGMSSLTKIAASAHAFAARIVASVAHSGNLREIARLNLLIHFRAHFHVMLRNPMNDTVLIIAP